jgi:predicted permease
VIVTLAVGIGANAGMFAAVSAVLLHPLPFAQPERLAVLWAADRGHAGQQVEVSFGDFLEWQRRSKTFQSFAALSSVNLDVALTGDGRPQQIEGMLTSAGFFDVLGARAALGRVPGADEVEHGGRFLGVISHRLWRTRYHSDPHIAGRTITADHGPVTIIGVMPADFDFPHNVDLWYPAPSAILSRDLALGVYRVIGRLAPGRTLAESRAEMESIARAIDARRGLGVRVEPFEAAIYGGSRAALWALMGAVGLLLFAACVNAANLLLSRAQARRNEMRLRAALGTGRGRLIRQVLTESLPSAVLSWGLGLLLAHYGLGVLVALAPKDIPRILEAGISPQVVIYSGLLTLLVVLLFALPAALEDGAPRKWMRNRLRPFFAVGQVAVSVVLISGAWSLARGFVERGRVDPGFRRDRVISFRLTLSRQEHASQDARKRFYRDVLERLRRTPGVESAAAVLLRPLAGTVGWDTAFTVEGQSAEEAKRTPSANYEAISPDYFRTMRIGWAAGRVFDSRDREGGEPVAIVSASMAHRYFPEGAVGRRIKLRQWTRIVGVAADVRYREWDAARFDIYVPVEQRAQHRSDFVVRTGAGLGGMSREIERVVAEVDKDQPVSSLATVEEIVAETFALPRVQVTLAAAFAGCALLVAATGLFAVLMQGMSERRKELGIRIALGAGRREVAMLVLREGLTLVGGGVALGAVAGVSAGAVSLGWTAVVVTAIGVAASAIPAMRAASVDPVESLRAE